MVEGLIHKISPGSRSFPWRPDPGVPTVPAMLQSTCNLREKMMLLPSAQGWLTQGAVGKYLFWSNIFF